MYISCSNCSALIIADNDRLDICEPCYYDQMQKLQSYKHVPITDNFKHLTDDDLKEITAITVYACTREYGGPEEGGWYYTDYRVLCSIPYSKLINKYALIDTLKIAFANENYGDMNSSCGGQNVVIYFERTAGEYSQGRPAYE